MLSAIGNFDPRKFLPPFNSSWPWPYFGVNLKCSGAQTGSVTAIVHILRRKLNGSQQCRNVKNSHLICDETMRKVETRLTSLWWWLMVTGDKWPALLSSLRQTDDTSHSISCSFFWSGPELFCSINCFLTIPGLLNISLRRRKFPMSENWIHGAQILIQ